MLEDKMKKRNISTVFVTRLLSSNDYCIVTFFRGNIMFETEIRKLYRIRRLICMLKDYPQKAAYTDNSVMVTYTLH